MEIQPVAFYRGLLGSKFAVPRQSGLVPQLRGRIVFAEPFRSPDAIRGLEGFSRIWLIWGFSANSRNVASGMGLPVQFTSSPLPGECTGKPIPGAYSLLVRPPRLGGNEKVGVFASRSPFRPNPVGLSCVQIERIDPEGPVIDVLGADLMDGTPIYDIKPYIPYADAFPDAKAGFAPSAPEAVLEVVEGPGWESPFNEEDTLALKQLLALDPRPAFHDDPGRIYGFPFGGFDIKFRVDGDRLLLLSARKI